jgi:hypothetical protein
MKFKLTLKLFFIFILFFNIFGLSFSQNKNFVVEAPKLKSKTQIEMKKIPTQLVVSLKISTSEIENQINKSVVGLLYEDDSYEDNSNDLLKIKVWKTNQAKVTSPVDDKLLINLPLKVWVSKGYSVLGFTTFQETEFELDLSFETHFFWNEQWKINSKTSYKEFKWISKPVLKFGMITIPITPFVEDVLTTKLKEFEVKIDEQISEKLVFKDKIIEYWNTFSNPVLVSKDYQTWIKISPLAIKSTPIKIQNSILTTQFGFDVFSESFVGQEPEKPKITDSIPKIELIDKLNTNFVFQSTANISYTKTTDLAKDKFLGKEITFKNGKYKINIENISLYPSEDKLVIAAKIKGSINGTVYIKGVPYYDEIKQELRLKNVDFDLKTSNLLYKFASWFLDGKVTKIIENEYGIPCKELLDFSKKKMNESFNKEVHKGILLSGKIDKIIPNSVFLNEFFLTLVIDCTMNAIIEIKNLEM